MNLYEIAVAYQGMAAQLADLSLPDEVIRDTLEGEIGGDLTIKAQNVAYVIADFESKIEGMKAAETRIAERRKQGEARVARLKQSLLTAMQMTNTQKIENEYVSITLRTNNPAVEVLDERQIPAEFMVQPAPPPARPDKTLIAKTIKAGQEVPGCKLSQSTRLVIA